MGVSIEIVGVGMVKFGEIVTKRLYSGVYLFLALYEL